MKQQIELSWIYHLQSFFHQVRFLPSWLSPLYQVDPPIPLLLYPMMSLNMMSMWMITLVPLVCSLLACRICPLVFVPTPVGWVFPSAEPLMNHSSDPSTLLRIWWRVTAYLPVSKSQRPFTQRRGRGRGGRGNIGRRPPARQTLYELLYTAIQNGKAAIPNQVLMREINLQMNPSQQFLQPTRRDHTIGSYSTQMILSETNWAIRSGRLVHPQDLHQGPLSSTLSFGRLEVLHHHTVQIISQAVRAEEHTSTDSYSRS